MSIIIPTLVGLVSKVIRKISSEFDFIVSFSTRAIVFSRPVLEATIKKLTKTLKWLQISTNYFNLADFKTVSYNPQDLIIDELSSAYFHKGLI